MRNKHVVDSLETDFVFAQLHLRAFTTIDEKKFVMQVHHLPGGIVLACRSCRPTTEYGNIERHKNKTVPLKRGRSKDDMNRMNYC